MEIQLRIRVLIVLCTREGQGKRFESSNTPHTPQCELIVMELIIVVLGSDKSIKGVLLMLVRSYKLMQCDGRWREWWFSGISFE